MATQYAPIAKDSSINTTENTPRNIADVLAEELSAIEQAIAGGSGSGGHTIVNASGTDMTQREKMQFVDAGVTDDSANNKTKVEIVQTISAESDLTSAPDGLYQGTWDESVSDVLTADMVGYGSGTVEDALDLMTPRQISTGDANIIAWKSGYVVSISFVNAPTAGAGVAFATFPDELKPNNIVEFKDSYSGKRIQIATSGAVSCTEALSSTPIRGTVTYVTKA